VSAPVFLVDTSVLDVVPGATVRLDGAEGRHAARVRRLGVGERVDLADGAGVRACCVVVTAEPDALVCEVTAREVESTPAPRVVVVQALAKGDRAEQAVEAMTEVGVDEVVPWAAARAVVKWRGERGEKALGRWRSTAREAAKQARRATVPAVAACASTEDVAARLHAAALGLVLHEGAETALSRCAVPSAGEVVLVVGPEGGLSDEERATFAAAGARTVRLGRSVLRTSTAGVAGAALVMAAGGRWG
jgi:16S rRNA (uracil1498-N3)-methyltransferase